MKSMCQQYESPSAPNPCRSASPTALSSLLRKPAISSGSGSGRDRGRFEISGKLLDGGKAFVNSYQGEHCIIRFTLDRLVEWARSVEDRSWSVLKSDCRPDDNRLYLWLLGERVCMAVVYWNNMAPLRINGTVVQRVAPQSAERMERLLGRPLKSGSRHCASETDELLDVLALAYAEAA